MKEKLDNLSLYCYFNWDRCKTNPKSSHLDPKCCLTTSNTAFCIISVTSNPLSDGPTSTNGRMTGTMSYGTKISWKLVFVKHHGTKLCEIRFLEKNEVLSCRYFTTLSVHNFTLHETYFSEQAFYRIARNWFLMWIGGENHLVQGHVCWHIWKT